MNTQRKAIAMIELIFALVIMGIVMMSAPMLISQSQKSTVVVLQQEAIAAGASNLNMIMSRHWDEADTNTTLGAPIITVDNGHAQLDNPRIGTPIGAKSNRKFIDNLGNEQNATDPSRFGPIVASTFENDDALSSYDDIDDFATIDNNLSTLLEVDSALRGDLVDIKPNTIGKKGMVFETEINYVEDDTTEDTFQAAALTYNPSTNSATSTNIKHITLTITTDSNIDELEKKIILKAFSSNIGTYGTLESTGAF